MNKYQNGKIYKLTDNTNGNIYIGSTTQTLNRRLQKHIYSYNTFLKTKKGYLSSCEIIKNNDYTIELICDYPCDTNRELEEKEQEYIDMYDCINKSRSYGNDLEKYKQTFKKHQLLRDRTTEQYKKWRKKANKVYREKNKEKINHNAKIVKQYKKSWGGDIRADNNNLLKIDPYLFL